MVTVLCAFAVRALKLTTGLLAPWLVGIGAGLLVGILAPEASSWLPAAIGLGALVHLLGDLFTTDGIPFPTWPLVLKPSDRSSSPLWQASGGTWPCRSSATPEAPGNGPCAPC